MTQIANVRTFNGTSDEIQLDATDYGGAIGAQSYVAIAKHASGTGFQWIVNVFGNGGSGGFGLGHQSTANIAMHQNDTARTTFVNATWQASDGWALVAATRADGNSTPRLHRYFYSIGGASWVHEDVSSALTESGTPAAPVQLWLGTREGSSNFFAGDIACVGLWQGTALSDANLETMETDIASWEALSPTGLWLLDQTSTAENLVDRVGNGDQVAINGTSVTAESGLAFDVGGDVGPGLSDAPPIGVLGRGAGW